MINIILENEFILFSLISLCIVIIFTQIATIELKFISKFIGDIIKNIFAIFVLSRITISLENTISKSNKESTILNILNIFYENYIWIVLILVVFYIIDKLTEKNISKNYSKYAVYSANLFIYITLTLNKSVWINGFSYLILMILKLYSYKKNINNKYKKLANSMGKTRYIFYIVSGLILTYNSLFVLKGRHNYEILIISGLFFYLLVFKKYRLEKKDDTEFEVEINELSDKEVNSKDKLFKTRKKELSYILSYFKKNINKIEEPFAMSISGRWGEGKSSFTNVLKKELEDEYIIFDIQPMVTDTREGLIKYFFSNLEKQFTYYGLSVGNGSSIENYFSSILKLIDSKGIISIKQEAKNLNSNKFDLREKKTDLQQDIKSLIDESGKNILIVVDDFDRVDNEVKYSMLTFIKEIINFNGIKSLILLDYSTLKKDGESKITYEFLEKFINKRFELSKLTIEEILEYYEKALTEESNNGLKADSDEILSKSKVIKNIKVEIDKIVLSIQGKIDESEKSIKNTPDTSSGESDENNIIYKKNSIKALKELKVKIESSIDNTRKIKRIIREVQDKVEYLNYIYSKFGKTEKESLIKNININSIIITMILIKVLYEDEFDNIIRSKDFSKYILNTENLEVYELIYCTIFKENKKIAHSYGIDEVDSKLIEFVNNIFICINTPENMFEFRKEEEILLDIISKKPIEFKKDKSVFENINEVYDKVRYSNLKSKMEDISEYISDQLELGQIEVQNAIKLIRPESNFVGMVKLNKKYINTLKKYLENETIIYNEISEKTRDRYVIVESIRELVDYTKKYIAFIISYRNFDTNGNTYDIIISDMEDYTSIKEINDYACRVCKNIHLDNSLSEIEKLLQWINLKQIYDDKIDCDQINKDIKETIDIIKDLEFIQHKMENSTLYKYRPKDYYNQVSYEEILKELKIIEFTMKDNNINDDDRYDLVVGFDKIVNRVSRIRNKENLVLENIEILDDIYSNMYYDLNFKKLRSEIDWNILYLSILTIKKNKEQLNKMA
ncbi:MAG: P-loop NTPase fold protein [Paeniclostridium sordellii]|nr:P-loop NTPase fold protein [Paeniclostridium sordellii]